MSYCTHAAAKVAGGGWCRLQYRNRVGVDGKAVICGFRPAVNLCRVAEINKYYTLGLSAGIQFSRLPGNKPSRGNTRNLPPLQHILCRRRQTSEKAGEKKQNNTIYLHLKKALSSRILIRSLSLSLSLSLSALVPNV